jgi:hypothetical protein
MKGPPIKNLLEKDFDLVGTLTDGRTCQITVDSKNRMNIGLLKNLETKD